MNTGARIPHRALQCCLLWAQGDERVQSQSQKSLLGSSSCFQPLLQQQEPSILCTLSLLCEAALRGWVLSLHIWEQMGQQPGWIPASKKCWGCLGMKEENLRQSWRYFLSFLKCQEMHGPIPSPLQAAEEMCADMRELFRWNIPEFSLCKHARHVPERDVPREGNSQRSLPAIHGKMFPWMTFGQFSFWFHIYF